MPLRLRGWPYAALLAEVLVFYRKILFGAHYVLPWDFRYYHFPQAWFAARSLARGELPLWDPYTYCGFPYYANLTTQVFYPPTTLALLLSNWTGGHHLLYWLELQLVAHVFVAGVCAFLLLRRLGAASSAALAGATVYQLGAFFASQAQHLGAVDAAAWLPLAWLSVIALADGFRWRRVAGLSLALALSFLSGFPALTIPVYISTAFLAALLVLLRRARLRILLPVAGAVLWSAALAAVQLLPTAQINRLSVASLRSEWMHSAGGFVLPSLITLVFPNHFGVFQFDGNTWRLPWNPTFLYLYCGIPALLFAAAALAWRRSRFAMPLGLVLLAGAFWMLGDSTPVGHLIFALTPGALKSALYSEFALPVFALSMAALAGLGAHEFLRGKRPLLQAAVVFVVAADLTAAGAGRPINTADERVEPGIAYDSFSGIPQLPARLRALVRQTFPPYRIDTLNGSINWAGCAMLFEVPTANGNDPFALVRYMTVRRTYCGGQAWGRYYEISDPASPVLPMLGVRYVVSNAPLAHPGPLRPAGDLPGQKIYEVPDPLPRFYLAGRVRHVHSASEAAALLTAPGFDPRHEALVEGELALPTGDTPLPPVRVLEYRPRQVTLSTDAPTPALLASSETNFPGWRAWIDGLERPLVTVNGAFRGLSLPPGHHTIRMRFDPPILRLGAAISLAALVALAAACAVGDNKRATPKWNS